MATREEAMTDPCTIEGCTKRGFWSPYGPRACAEHMRKRMDRQQNELEAKAAMLPKRRPAR